MKIDTEFENKKIIPQPADKGTRWFTTIERIRDRLPSLDGKAGKYLKVSGDEEHCEWASGGGGGSVSFADITGHPEENQALASALGKKIDASTTSSMPIRIGCDAEGLYYEV